MRALDEVWQQKDKKERMKLRHILEVESMRPHGLQVEGGRRGRTSVTLISAPGKW